MQREGTVYIANDPLFIKIRLWTYTLYLVLIPFYFVGRVERRAKPDIYAETVILSGFAALYPTYDLIFNIKIFMHTPHFI